MDKFNSRMLLVATSVLVCFCPTLEADVIINENSFANTAGFGAATDFHLQLSRGQFLDNPKAQLPNGDLLNQTGGGKNTNTADFGGGTLAAGQSLKVTFSSNQKNPSPQGFFTNGNRRSLATPSLDLNGNPVRIVPSGTGFDIALDVFNDFGSPITGSANVYVNTGALGHLNLDEFDTLRNANLILSLQNFQLASDEGFFGIPVHLTSPDDYVLITGFANSGDGLGELPFASAFLPEVSEPATITTAGFAILSFIGCGWIYGRRQKSFRS